MQRHKAREAALRVLYQWDVADRPVERSLREAVADMGLEDESTEFVQTLVFGVIDRAERLDQALAGVSKGWKPQRMAVIDRNIMRLALFEMKVLETPVAVAIDEAVELAKRYAEARSAAFINGVLDQLAGDRGVLGVEEE